MEKLTQDLPNSDEEIRQMIIEASDLEFTPRTGGNPRANWESCKKFRGMVSTFKQAFRAFGMYAVVRTALRIAKRVVKDSLEYYGENREPETFEIVSVAVGNDGLTDRFIRGAISEIFAERVLNGRVITEFHENRPMPQNGDSWEKAGWDVVVADGREFRAFQVKAKASKPPESAKKQAHDVFWLKVKKGEYYFKQADIVEY